MEFVFEANFRETSKVGQLGQLAKFHNKAMIVGSK